MIMECIHLDLVHTIIKILYINESIIPSKMTRAFVTCYLVYPFINLDLNIFSLIRLKGIMSYCFYSILDS